MPLSRRAQATAARCPAAEASRGFACAAGTVRGAASWCCSNAPTWAASRLGHAAPLKAQTAVQSSRTSRTVSSAAGDMFPRIAMTVASVTCAGDTPFAGIVSPGRMGSPRLCMAAKSTVRHAPCSGVSQSARNTNRRRPRHVDPSFTRESRGSRPAMCASASAASASSVWGQVAVASRRLKAGGGERTAICGIRVERPERTDANTRHTYQSVQSLARHRDISKAVGCGKPLFRSHRA
ncbi:hypothetical protein DFJ74DRAFT_653017 [Hyaloraphidium curvatum]|nr:hypothetical protein DFJ74DRAFT_653017 [Hyaloraphidium curvatum]